MRYSQSTELALDSLFFIAAHPEKSDFSVDEVAKAQRVSTSYLAKIFQQLSKAGVLRSHRGAKGGYSLGRSTGEITLLDIARVCEGTSPLYDCNAMAKNCNLGPNCLVVSTFRKAEVAMEEVLAGVSLEDLVNTLPGVYGLAEWIGAKAKGSAAAAPDTQSA